MFFLAQYQDVEELPKVQYYTITAVDDEQFHVIDTDLWCRDANIHCVTNNSLYGDVTTQVVPFNNGDVISFQDFNLKQLWFRNATAGSNTTIYVVAIIMSDKRRRELGL